MLANRLDWLHIISQDIHYLASDLGNTPLAEVAKQHAIQIDNEPLTSGRLESFDQLWFAVAEK